MPQYRKFHVKTTESLDINDMPDDFYRLLWVMLPLGLCREGRGINNPSWIKSKIMPLRNDVTPDMVEDAMDWFAARGMIVRYEVKNRSYFYIPTFKKYQGNTTKEAESIYPPPPKELQTNSRVTPDLVSLNDEDIDIASASTSESESESESSNGKSEQPFAHLATAFINTSKIPSFGSKQRDVEAGARMVEAGVTAEDVEAATRELLDKGMNIVSLASVENASYMVMSKRMNAANNERQYREVY